jgi:hypothetical protein
VIIIIILLLLLNNTLDELLLNFDYVNLDYGSLVKKRKINNNNDNNNNKHNYIITFVSIANYKLG